jgi:hypothetical protein
MRLTRTDDETFDNDAKACYDRIIPNLTSICAQRLDMKPINAKLHSVILQQAEYTVKSTSGTSRKWYSSTGVGPVYDLGQVSTAAAFASSQQ